MRHLTKRTLFLHILSLPSYFFLVVFASDSPSLFVRLGGKTGVNSLAKAFILELSQDQRLGTQLQFRELKKVLNTLQVQDYISDEICKASGGPCKPIFPATLRNKTQHLELTLMDWLYIAQDATQAMNRKKLGAKERADLFALLLKAQESN